MRFRRILLIACFFPGLALAQSHFLPAQDFRLREDLTLLVDEGVVNLPLNEWPLARADVSEAVMAVRVDEIQAPALQRALGRVVAATTLPGDAGEWRLREVSLSAGNPGLLRDDSTIAREEFEVGSSGGVVTDRFSIRLKLTGVASPADDQHLRLDGSELTVRWGNWLFSANQMDRWWGPGRDGSLILSTNARPMPALSLDRFRSLPVNLPVLRWLGPWRFSGFLGLMEEQRADVDRPVFMGMRLSFKPAPIFEVGLSRTAQFCGRGRRCDLATFGRVLIGRDNPGYRGLNDPDKEPGNQMAGIDVRIVSPVSAVPLAVHAQMIGEDNSSSAIPERYLAQFGAETWFLLDSGATVRAHVEYANNSCKWYRPSQEPDCAYRQGTFFAGYRYRGRNIGHTTDSDSETTSMMLSVTAPGGDRWALRGRRGRLNPYGTPDPYNLVSPGPSRFQSLEIGWEGGLRTHLISAQLGYQDQALQGGEHREGLFGFIRWRKPL